MRKNVSVGVCLFVVFGGFAILHHFLWILRRFYGTSRQNPALERDMADTMHREMGWNNTFLTYEQDSPRSNAQGEADIFPWISGRDTYLPERSVAHTSNNELKNFDMIDRISLYRGFIHLQHAICIDSVMLRELSLHDCFNFLPNAVLVPLATFPSLNATQLGKWEAQNLKGSPSLMSANNFNDWKSSDDKEIFSQRKMAQINESEILSRNNHDSKKKQGFLDETEAWKNLLTKREPMDDYTDPLDLNIIREEYLISDIEEPALYPLKPTSASESSLEDKQATERQTAIPSHLSLFKSRINQPTYELALQLMQDVSQLLEILNSTAWWIGQGSALGTIRHAGRIIWDDDLDWDIAIGDFIPLIGVLDAPSYEVVEGTPLARLNKKELRKHIRIESNRPRYKQLSFYSLGRIWWLQNKKHFAPNELEFIRKVQRNLTIKARPLQFQWSAKIFYRDRPQTPAFSGIAYDWTYPYLDFFTYFPSDEAFHALADFHINFTFNEIFPLHHRPFDNLAFSTNHRPMQLIYTTFGKDAMTDCYSGFYDHTREASFHPRSVACKELYAYFPFVHNSRSVSVHMDQLPAWLKEQFLPYRVHSIESFWKRHDALVQMVKQRFGIQFDMSSLAKLYSESSRQSGESGNGPIWRGEGDNDLKRYLRMGEKTKKVRPSLQSPDTQSGYGAPLDDTRENNNQRYGVWAHSAVPLTTRERDELKEVADLLLSQVEMNPAWESLLAQSVRIEEVWRANVKIHTYMIFGGDYSTPLVRQRHENPNEAKDFKYDKKWFTAQTTVLQ